MPTQTEPAKIERAARYMVQALDRITELRDKIALTADAGGLYMSLQRNVESALADLGGDPDAPPATPQG